MIMGCAVECAMMFANDFDVAFLENGRQFYY